MKREVNRMNSVLESFIDNGDDIMEIVEEASIGYKLQRKFQISKLSLKKQFNDQKNDMEAMYSTCKNKSMCDHCIETIEKRKAGIQRKINGTEIKDRNKSVLEQMIYLYDQYLSKFKSLRSTLPD